MNIGKEKCETLRAVRRTVAERYNLEYTPSECTYQGDCPGTCPKCDAELRSLQKQLEQRGINDIDLNLEIPEEENNSDLKNPDTTALQGDIMRPQDTEDTITMGEPAPPHIYRRRKRVLYKECQIAGITFHDLDDIWDELYEGTELALIREKSNKYDKNAIAVALSDDYDGNPEDFDFDYILGYVPRTENEHLANMMDMGLAEAFECVLSRIDGDNPHTGKLYMKIYIVSKNEVEVTDHLLRAVELDDEEYAAFTSSLINHGCSYFRWGGFPPWESNLPKKNDKVVFMHRQENDTDLFLMHCIAVGDEDAAYFVDDKDSLYAIDDCCYYVFTNVKGPVKVLNEDLEFLLMENINQHSPEDFLSKDASSLLNKIFYPETGIPKLEYKGYKAILTLNPEDNRLYGKIHPPENPSTPMNDWGFAGDNIEEAEKVFHYQVDKIISHKEFKEKCIEWKSKTDYESIRCVMNILPDEFKQRVNERKFDNTLLDVVKGGDYEVPLYYVTKAWDIILKGELDPIDFKIGPEEEKDCTEADIQEFLAEEHATRTRYEACLDNNKMKKMWKDLFNIDIDTLEIDFLRFSMHLPPNVSYKEYQEYFEDVLEGIDEWILYGINHPDNEAVSHDEVSSLMEFTAEVLSRRKGEL